MKLDHERAKKLARALIETGCQGEAHANLVTCYLDAMARLDKATELLRDAERVYIPSGSSDLGNAIRAFLDERKTQ